MKIVILGGQGMLGQEMLWRWQDTHTIFPLSRANLDLLEAPESIAEKLRKLSPDVVINAAAYTHVETAEQNIDDAFAINTLGAENVAIACASLHLPLLFISTDFVFDGKKGEPYTETDTKKPLSVYGKSKSEGEDRVLSIAKKSWVVRTSWLYGAFGPNFVISMRHLLRTKKTVSVVNDQIGTPTWTRDLADAILSILEQGEPYGVFHCGGGGEPVSWYGFASAIASLDPRATAMVKPVLTTEYPQEAVRPAFSVLASTRRPPLRPWREALAEFFAE